VCVDHLFYRLFVLLPDRPMDPITGKKYVFT